MSEIQQSLLSLFFKELKKLNTRYLWTIFHILSCISGLMIKHPQLLMLQSSAREGSYKKTQNAERSITVFRAMFAVLFPASASLITLSCDLCMLVVFSNYFLLLLQRHFFI